MTAELLDAVVLGLGIHGSAATYELATRGLSVAAVEQFEPGHGRGSSHGATRMIRRAYPDPVWNELVDHAYRGWQRWEDAAGGTLLHRTGGVYAHRGGSTLQGGRSGAVAAAQVTELMPSIRLPAGYHAVHDPDAGALKAAAALSFAQQAAVSAGARLFTGERVLDWTTHAGTVTVRTDRRNLQARRLVLAGGPWLGRLLPRYARHLEVWRILVYAAPAGQELARAPRLGMFSVDLPDGLVFGLAEADGHGAKIGVDVGAVWDPEVPVAPPTPAEVELLTGLLHQFVPGIRTDGGEAASCLYTMTTDRRFAVGPLPGQPEIVLAAACSGHGFKFGPAVGEAVADLVQGVDRADLDFVSPHRWEVP